MDYPGVTDTGNPMEGASGDFETMLGGSSGVPHREEKAFAALPTTPRTLGVLLGSCRFPLQRGKECPGGSLNAAVPQEDRGAEVGRVHGAAVTGKAGLGLIRVQELECCC